MKISVIGCGYLGAVHAAAMASIGHDVVGIDVDAARVDALASGAAPFYEPGLDALLAETIAAGRLRFSTDIGDAAGSAIHFIAVGTPQAEGSDAADLRYINAAVDALLPQLRAGQLVVGKSTVPVGTAAGIAERISGTGARLAWNPEFVREGFAVSDTIRPDRLVYGLPNEGADEARALLDTVYAAAIAAGTPVVAADYATAELVKVAANAFLATKISFINAMAEIAEVVDADVTKLADALGHDSRIGRRFLNAGVGFGGGCLPKDIRAFTARAEELGRGESVAFLRDVDAINLRRRAQVARMAIESRGDSDAHVAVLGLAFKPDSDDVRDSPALEIARQLADAGIPVAAYDPKAMANAAKSAPAIRYAESAEDAYAGAAVVVLATEWREFRELDPAVVAAAAEGNTIIDGRNVLEPDAWRAAGWTYRGLGKR